jgi:hypothetical protein
MHMRFKKDKRETGLRGIGQRLGYDVSISGKKFARIFQPQSFDKEISNAWKVMISINCPADEANPAGWKNVVLKAKFESDKQAMEWLETKYPEIAAKYSIHFIDK